MSKQIAEQHDFEAMEKLPIGFFLSSNEEENLRHAFDAPEIIRQCVNHERPYERRLAVGPIIVCGLILAGVVVGVSGQSRLT